MQARQAHSSSRATDASPIRLGAMVFLASELLLFGGMFAAYFALRGTTSPWPPAGATLDTRLSAIATLVLIASSFTFIAAERAVGRGALGAFTRWVVLTLVLGSVFLSMQVYDWTRLDFEISSHAYGTLYYTLTGVHGLHVLAGLTLMLVLLGRLAQGAYRGSSLDGPAAVGYYWHFVDVVWIALFAVVFLLR
jgi:cytochrome c oxidase subunit 3